MTAREFRVLVTGSRDWTDAQTIREALMEYSQEPQARRIVLVHGAARGADMLADLHAERWGWRVERYPAKWGTFGRRAGFLRNQRMVNLGADVCLAFIRNGSPGASMCADMAERAGIPTYRYREDS